MFDVFPWSKIITMVISVIALVFSVWGLYFSFSANILSNKANELSENALEQTKSHFIIQNRPYLNAKLITFKENDSYFLFQQKEKSFVITVQFKLTNKGNVPAKNITVEGPFSIEAAPSHPAKEVIFQIPPTITLGPDESKVYQWNIEIGYGNFTIEEVKKQIENKIFEADVTMVWKYTSALDQTKTYESNISYFVKHDSVIVLKSEID